MILKNVRKITIKMQNGLAFYVVKFKRAKGEYKASFIVETTPFVEFYFDPEALINPKYEARIADDLIEEGARVTKAELIMIVFNRGPIA